MMIHDLDTSLGDLIGYANDLAFEWGWKRVSEAHQQAELKRLLLAISQAQKLKIKLAHIDKLRVHDE